MFGEIINLLYPAMCQACGKKTESWNEHVCAECRKKIKNRLPPFCSKCGRQINSEPDITVTCGDCKKQTPYFDRANSACYYEDPLKKLVHSFKYKKMTSLSGEFAGIIINFMKKHDIGNKAEIIVSVPMHPMRLFKREINHSEELAKNIALRLCLSYSKNLLKKTKDTKIQTKLNRPERLKNISDSFRVTDDSKIKNKNVLIIDDLFTTGSTVNECSKILKESGAAKVEVVTLARGDRLT